MNTSLINSTVSMNGLQEKLDILSNNIANMNTVGYKRHDASFQDILTSLKQQVEEQQLPGRLTPLGLNQGWGARLTQQQLDFTQGSLQQTDNPLDLAIEGNGLFEIDTVRLGNDGEPVLDENGAVVFDRAWTRNGAFQLTTQPGDTENGYLATSDGHLLRGTNGDFIRIPKDSSVVVDETGRVLIRNTNDPEALSVQVAQLKLVRVLRPQMLENIGNNLYTLPNGVEDTDLILQPLEEFGAEGIAVRQGFLEQSNVILANEMVELLKIQRAYQMNAQAIKSSDTMMSLANQLRG